MSSSCAVLHQLRYHHHHSLIRNALPKLSSSVFRLIGPPEIYQTPFLPPSPPPPPPPPPQQQPPPPSNNPPTSSPFIDLMVKNFNQESIYGRTENGSPTFVSSGNPLLDFFFHVVPDTPSESVIKRLELAWNYDPLKALKLICNLRGVRGTGKSDKEGFYAAALWLHKHHPKTLACNVKVFAEFGYFKDLPEILHRLVEEGEEKEEVEEKVDMCTKRKMCCTYKTWRPEMIFIQKIPREVRIQEDMKRGQLVKEKASALRNKKRIKKAIRAIERYNGDANYRFLHDRISEVFADCLVSDLQILNSGEFYKISFASKWCPSLNLFYDQSTLLCESIARRLFPRESYPEYEKIDEVHYAYRIRDRLRKEVLAPLRKALELPEIYMSSNRWELLPYNRVTSVAMKNYTNTFVEHDEERFKSYLESVKRGEKKIAAGALLPHQIISALAFDDCDVAELQWRQMVEDLYKIGKLKDCLAICDVSNSMSGTPMDVSVALGLLISEMSQEPWKGKVITFSNNPQLHKILGDNLRSKTEFIRRMEWGWSTNFQKVFDQILQVAVDGNLKEDQMIKRLFVFSDMEFNEATGKVSPYFFNPYFEQGYDTNDWETDYQVIQKKFKERGYMNVPEIVFWNLRNSNATPVMGEQKGVALVSGFSKNLLKLFLENGNFDDIKPLPVMEPLAVMERAISGKEYDKLVVVD